MGIPGFFAWLQRKYPGIVKDVETRAVDFDDLVGDISSSNCGGGGGGCAAEFRCRNLYLDTNGIIHAGAHPQGQPAPTGEGEMFQTMHAVLERIVALAQPTDLLFIAIDGVAPRAKINQQRARRFVAARDRGRAQQAVAETVARVRHQRYQQVRAASTVAAASATEAGRQQHDDDEEEEEEEGQAEQEEQLPLPHELEQAAAVAEAATCAAQPEWDHNAISPGTAFMDRMIASLKAFVARRMAEEGGASTCANGRGWASPHLQVVFSDSSVPGEGEHKIMDFIRREKVLAAAAAADGQGGDRNGDVFDDGVVCTHCIYGEDADLIMLALALHDPRVRVMRQLQQYKRHELVVPESIEATPFAVVDVGVLRRHLGADLFLPLKERLYVVNARRAVNATPTAAGGSRNVGRDQGGQVEDGAPLEFDLERAIDDFVLLGFLIGNDFVPALPALDIRLGALELLLEIHAEVFASDHGGGWLTDGGTLNYAAFGTVLARLASVESALLQQNGCHKRRARRGAQYHRGRKPLPKSLAAGAKPCTKFAEGRNCRKGKRCAYLHDGDVVPLLQHEQRKEDEMKQMLLGYLADDTPSGETELDVSDAVYVNSKKSMAGLYDLCAMLGLDYNEEDVAATGDVYLSKYPSGDSAAATRRQLRLAKYLKVKAAADFQQHQEGEAARILQQSQACDDLVAVGTPGFRQRFYEQKLGSSTALASATATPPVEAAMSTSALRQQVDNLCSAYIEGLQWVLGYYHSGCVAWDWYYPGHYAPFALELAAYVRSSTFQPPSFELGQPLRPFEQLMAILPASSARHLLPAPLAAAVDAPAQADLYPPNSDTLFEMDPNGQAKEYQWIPLLPFLDTQRVVEVATAAEVKVALTKEERRRNSVGAPQVLSRGGRHLARAWAARGFPGAVGGTHAVAVVGSATTHAAIAAVAEEHAAIEIVAEEKEEEEVEEGTLGGERTQLVMGVLDMSCGATMSGGGVDIHTSKRQQQRHEAAQWGQRQRNGADSDSTDRVAITNASASDGSDGSGGFSDGDEFALFGDDGDDGDALFGASGGDEQLRQMSRAEAAAVGAEDDDMSLFAASFADKARQQKFAPLGTLDAAMVMLLRQPAAVEQELEQPDVATMPAAEESQSQISEVASTCKLAKALEVAAEAPFLPMGRLQRATRE